MLRRIAGGDTYTVIYLKMLLKSLQTDGKMYYEGVSSDFIEEIALDIDEDYENVSITVQFLKSKGLLVDSGVDEVELVSVQKMVGSETADAERQRRKRERDKLQINTKRDNVTPVSRVGHVEIEKEIDIELEQETKPDDDDLINKLSELLRNKPLAITPEGIGLIGGKLKALKRQSNADVIPMLEYCLDYALAFGKNNPVKYALVSLNNSVSEGCLSVEDLRQKETDLNISQAIEGMGDIPVDVDIQNTDWSKF